MINMKDKLMHTRQKYRLNEKEMADLEVGSNINFTMLQAAAVWYNDPKTRDEAQEEIRLVHDVCNGYGQRIADITKAQSVLAMDRKRHHRIEGKLLEHAICTGATAVMKPGISEQNNTSIYDLQEAIDNSEIPLIRVNHIARDIAKKGNISTIIEALRYVRQGYNSE